MSKSTVRPTILVCDDELGIRESFKLILEDDYNLIFAENGLEALEKVKAGARPDLILLDIKMPKVHGMQILKELKLILDDTPVIIISGYQSVEMAQEAVKYGAVDYLPKPFGSKELLKAVADTLQKK